jgi:hypothetical protein
MEDCHVAAQAQIKFDTINDSGENYEADPPAHNENW